MLNDDNKSVTNAESEAEEPVEASTPPPASAESAPGLFETAFTRAFTEKFIGPEKWPDDGRKPVERARELGVFARILLGSAQTDFLLKDLCVEDAKELKLRDEVLKFCDGFAIGPDVGWPTVNAKQTQLEPFKSQKISHTMLSVAEATVLVTRLARQTASFPSGGGDDSVKWPIKPT